MNDDVIISSPPKFPDCNKTDRDGTNEDLQFWDKT
jgi:hypothetical protein